MHESAALKIRPRPKRKKHPSQLTPLPADIFAEPAAPAPLEQPVHIAKPVIVSTASREPNGAIRHSGPIRPTRPTRPTSQTGPTGPTSPTSPTIVALGPPALAHAQIAQSTPALETDAEQVPDEPPAARIETRGRLKQSMLSRQTPVPPDIFQPSQPLKSEPVAEFDKPKITPRRVPKGHSEPQADSQLPDAHGEGVTLQSCSVAGKTDAPGELAVQSTAVEHAPPAAGAAAHLSGAAAATQNDSAAGPESQPPPAPVPQSEPCAVPQLSSARPGARTVPAQPPGRRRRIPAPMVKPARAAEAAKRTKPPALETGSGGTSAAPPPAARPVLIERKPAGLKAALDAEALRLHAWNIGERKPFAAYVAAANHCALAFVSPAQAFVHWRIQQSWVDETARVKGEAWHNCRLIVRLYDVSGLEFNGVNAHRLQDADLGGLAGWTFMGLPHAGSCQLAEVGFLLRGGEFVAAARSGFVRFPPAGVSGRSDHAGLVVDEQLKSQEVVNLWEHAQVLEDSRKPKLRPLRIATFAFQASALGQQGLLPTFVTELAAGQKAAGHQVWVLMPRSAELPEPREIGGVTYYPLPLECAPSPIETAWNFARAAEQKFAELPKFDLFHLHEWMTGLAPWLGTQPTVLSLTSTETTRLNGAAPSPLSQEISRTEREVLRVAEYVLTPAWLRDRLVSEFSLDAARVHAFPMEGKLATPWESPLDAGKVKQEFGFGPLDRVIVFVGPLEYASGADILVEALPVVLHRTQNCRVALVGAGSMQGHIQQRAAQLGIGHAVRLLGELEGESMPRLLRSCELLILPSRQRVEFDEAVVELGRRAARPVITTHVGPAHLVQHEQNGVLTYDNPGSIVWALDRLLGDAGNAERMGQTGKLGCHEACSWKDVARLYLELCAKAFPELTAPGSDKEVKTTVKL